MAERAALGFGGLLRRLRAEAGLAQEELAEAARLSRRSASDLERGINRTARKETDRPQGDGRATSPDREQGRARRGQHT